MPIRQLTLGGTPAVALAGAAVEVVLVPTQAFRLAHLRRAGGREWLRGGADGGWRETLEAAERDAPATGDDLLRHAAWEASLLEHAAGVTLAARVTLAAPALVFQRELTVHATDAAVRLVYALRNTGDRAVDVTWGSEAAWTSRPGTLLHVPGLRQVQVVRAEGRPDLEAGDVVSWPGAVGGDHARFRVADTQSWSVACIGDLGAPGRITLIDPQREERLELRAPDAGAPHVGLELLAGQGAEAPPGVRVAPRIGVPRALRVAREAGTAARLEAGTERRWALDLRLVDPLRDDEAPPPDA